jgi:hypothetical protein
MEILEKQNSLIQQKRALPYGVYSDLIENVNTKYFDAKKFGLVRRTERKAWIFFGFYSEDITCGFAIADAGIAATAFSYIFIPKENIFVEDKIALPLAFGNSFDPNLYDRWKIQHYSIQSINQQMHLDTQNKHFQLSIKANNNRNGFSAVAPSKGKRPFHFTYKNLLVDTEVNIKYKNKTYTASGKFGSIDFSKGYPPRKTMWNWLSFIGKTETGKDIAANIVDNFNDNLENVLYINDKKIILSKANFLYKKPLDRQNWQINTIDNLLHLEVKPQGKRSEDLNFILMKSKFTQVFGTIPGTVRLDGKLETFTAFGVTEEHFALW